MIMLLIMGNFKKENLSSIELNCFCFYIKVRYFFYTIWEKRRLNHPRVNFADLSRKLMPQLKLIKLFFLFNQYWKHFGKFYLHQNNLFARAQKRPCRTCQRDSIQHVRLKSLLIFCSWICFSLYLVKHSCVSIAMNSRNLKKGEMPEATTT